MQGIDWTCGSIVGSTQSNTDRHQAPTSKHCERSGGRYGGLDWWRLARHAGRDVSFAIVHKGGKTH